MKPDNRLVFIQWVDSSSVHGWSFDDPNVANLVVHSVGWIIAETSKSVVICSHITDEENPQRNSAMTIPRCSILSIKKIKTRI